MSFPIPLDTRKLKEVLVAKQAGNKYDLDTFSYLHLYRNYFNVGREVSTLTHISGEKYVDNLGYTWYEISVFKNWFHMPKGNYFSTLMGKSVPYSRKFLRNDDTPGGMGGEFEMIIRHDGKRIDALTQESYQETYNYGNTSNEALHKLLDVDPHENPNYQVKKDCGWTQITDKK